MDRSTRQARLERRRGEERRGQFKWIIYIVLVALAIAALLIYSSRVRAPEERTYTEPHGMSLGNPDAPVQMVEYADFQCPICGNFHAVTENKIIEEYVNTGKVFYTYRLLSFLDRGTSTESSRSAEAGFCAADQNKFWEFHDVVFANQRGENAGAFLDNRLTAFAESISLDMDQFNSCFQNGEKTGEVTAAMAEASAVGVTGTPSFLINGQLYGGIRPFEELQQIIEAALVAAGSN